jgi:aminoglycoside phosphotransferase (APT) family kinase protein
LEPLEVLQAHFPALEIHDVRTIDDGWDSLVLEVDGEYVFRFPRRPAVEEWVERETRLLPALAEVLPVAVPRFEFVAHNGLLCVGYRKLVGGPASADLDERAGEDLARFLAALHGFPVERARSLGVPFYEPDAWHAMLEGFCGDLRERVLPLLSRGERAPAERFLHGIPRPHFEPVLLHGDLGPEHVLCHEERVVGVIDWSDARVGDPALDLAWCLNGSARVVAEAVARTYGVDPSTRERSLWYHRLGPWHEVVYGLETGWSRFVESGVAGIRARLPS